MDDDETSMDDSAETIAARACRGAVTGYAVAPSRTDPDRRAQPTSSTVMRFLRDDPRCLFIS